MGNHRRVVDRRAGHRDRLGRCRIELTVVDLDDKAVIGFRAVVHVAHLAGQQFGMAERTSRGQRYIARIVDRVAIQVAEQGPLGRSGRQAIHQSAQRRIGIGADQVGGRQRLRATLQHRDGAVSRQRGRAVAGAHGNLAAQIQGDAVAPAVGRAAVVGQSGHRDRAGADGRVVAAVAVGQAGEQALHLRCRGAGMGQRHAGGGAGHAD